MKSLYEQNPKNWDKLAAAGRPNLREMAKKFHRAIDMDKALGLNNATSHWHTGRNGAGSAIDQLAMYWLERNAKGLGQLEPAQGDLYKHQPSTDTRMLLIVATPDQAAKIEKIVALIGAELTDV